MSNSFYKEEHMNQQQDHEELRKLIDKYEKSLQDCSLVEFRELRYKLKQVKEKLRSRTLMKKHG